MSRNIVKSFIYAADKRRIVLDANFDDSEVMLGFSVRQIRGWSPKGDQNETETIEDFPVKGQPSQMHAYKLAQARFKELVVPLI